MRTVVLVFPLLLAAGCTVSNGVKVDPQQMQTFTPGTTTEAEVVRALGQPSSATHTSGGAILTYVFTASTASAANFIPGLALVKGRTDSSTQICQIFLDAHGLFQRSSCDANTSTQSAPLATGQKL